MIYQNASISLESDRFTEGEQTARVIGDALIDADGNTHLYPVPEELPKVNSMVPMLNALYRISVKDHQDLIIDKQAYHYANYTRGSVGGLFPEAIEIDSHVFWAGKNFNTFIYTRDTSYSSFLGTSFIFPQIVKEHLRYTRKLRRALGFTVSETHTIPMEGIEQKVLPVDEWEFARMFNTNSYTRRTDDIVWILGYWECCKATGLRSDLQYMLDQFDYFDAHFYTPFYDETDGLYRGQASFIDIGGCGYPGFNNQQGILVKALSTNCLYARAFQIMAKAAGILGLPEREKAFSDRAEKIRAAILKNFRDEKGIYRYYINVDGTLSDRQEILGISFLSLFDILPPEVTPAIAGYPKNDYGFPLIWPFYENKQIYHNNSIWPFADMFLYLAKWKIYRNETDLLEAVGKFARHSLHGNFNEMLEYEGGIFHGCPGYIWSDAAYLSILFRMIAGIDTEDYGKVKFNPCLPRKLGDIFMISNIRLQNCTFDLCLHGNGMEAKKMTVDGTEVSDFTLILDDEHHDIHIYF